MRSHRHQILDACSGCAGDYENPDLTAPDLEAEKIESTEDGPDAGRSAGRPGDVENPGSERHPHGNARIWKMKKNKR